VTDPEPFDKAEFDRRRKQGAIVTALLLVGMVVLFYFITLTRIQGAS
jgi:hypothetical protein